MLPPLLRINDDNVKDKGGDKVIKKMGGIIKRNVNQTKKPLNFQQYAIENYLVLNFMFGAKVTFFWKYDTWSKLFLYAVLLCHVMVYSRSLTHMQKKELLK